MGEAMMNQDQLEQIGNYVKNNIGSWIKEQNIYPFPPQDKGIDKELLERMVRVEEGLKFQNEKLEQTIVHFDKRFETVDKRFEDMQHNMDKRFSQLTWFMSTGFVILGVLISVYQFLS